MLMQLPTPLDCMSNTPRSPPSQAPASSATPSSSLDSGTVVTPFVAAASSMRAARPASGT